MSVFRFGAPTTTSTPIPNRKRSYGSNNHKKDTNRPTYAFSTSPSILQDITLEKTELGGKNSTTGLTMKEYEEQLKKLTAENFNLKLRIYFIEERLSKVNGINDKEDLIKQNIQLKVQCESQSKELEKKQELLFEASKAFELLQKEHEEEIDKLAKEKGREIEELQTQTALYEQTLKEFKAGLTGKDSLESISGIDTCIKSIEDYEKQISELENCLHLEEERRRELENNLKDSQLELESYHLKSERLEKELEQRRQRIEELVEELEQKEQELAATNFQTRKLENELHSREREDEILKERLEDKSKAVESLKNSLLTRDSTIAALENRIAKEKSSTQSLQSKLDAFNFQNMRLKEEVEMLQSRLRSASDLSPRGKSRISVDATASKMDDSYKQKYEEFVRVMEEREEEHFKQLKELEEKILEKNNENVEYQQIHVKYRKLEDDHRKACSALKNFIKRSADEKKERENLNTALKTQEDIINDLKSRLSRFSVNMDKDSQDDKLSLPETGDNERKYGSPEGDKNICCREKEEQIEDILSALEKKDNLIEEYEKKISTCSCGVEEKMERISELEAEVIVLKCQLEDQNNDGIKRFLTTELEAKRREIEKLNGELKKRNYNLQELVNKELWDKNRQIEKLEKRLNAMLRRKEAEATEDRVGGLGMAASVSLSEIQNGGDLARIAEKTNCEERRNPPDRDVETFQNLKSNLFRKEAAEVCGILTSRLEELAAFLDSLLANRDLLGGLGIARRQAIKQALDESRELSRRLSSSFASESVDGNGSVIDNYRSLCDSKSSGISANRDKVISEQSAAIVKLREQLKALNRQIEQRDVESKRQSDRRPADESTTLDYEWRSPTPPDEEERTTAETSRFDWSCRRASAVPENKREKSAAPAQEASESEAWSEPDRSVSLARMGKLEDAGIAPLRNWRCNDSTESSEGTLNETSRNSVKRSRSSESELRRLQSRIKLLDEANEALRSEIEDLKNAQPDATAKAQDNEDPNLEEKLKITLEKLHESRLSCKQLEEKLSAALERASASATQLVRATETIAALEEEVKLLKEELKEKNDEIGRKSNRIAELESRIEEIGLESELRLIEAVKEREAAERKTLEVERKLKDAENRSKDVEGRIDEIEKSFGESKKFKEAEKEMEAVKEEAERIRMEEERKRKDVQSFVDFMRKEVEEKTKEAEKRVRKAEKDKEEAEKEVTKLKKQLTEAEKRKTEVEARVKENRESIRCMEEKVKELEAAMDECDEGAQKKIKEIQEKAEARIIELEREMEERERIRKTEMEKKCAEGEKIARELEIGFKRQLEDAEKKVKKARENAELAIRRAQEDFKKQESELRQRVAEAEFEKNELCAELRRQVDEIRVEASAYELELTRLTNEKIRLEEELKRMLDKESALIRNHNEIKGKYEKSIHQLENKLCELTMNKTELSSRLDEIESTNTDLVSRISAMREKEASEREIASASPPTSPALPRRSPLCSLPNDAELCFAETGGKELRAERSAGASEETALGVRSAEAFAPPRRNLNSSPDLGIESDPGRFSSLEAQNLVNGDYGGVAIGNKEESEIRKLENENAELRRRLMKTRQALEETLNQLSAANQRKKQVERAICKQLHKTHHILKKARVNFEGQETDSVE